MLFFMDPVTSGLCIHYRPGRIPLPCAGPPVGTVRPGTRRPVHRGLPGRHPLANRPLTLVPRPSP